MPRASTEESGIERQIMLPWRQSLLMSKQNIFVRLGRAVITASGIFLGIAFLSSVLTSSAILSGQGELPPDLQARNAWLVVMSLLVATLGIVNSMLMSVTERYKEIGTMKCLGALDTFIVRLFLIESAMLGLIGAALGALVGSGVICLVYLVGKGPAAFRHVGQAVIGGGLQLPLTLSLVLAVLLGGLLAILAAIYPAWRAAKMPPAAALRSEI
jgi:predicted lysophospholipase L1 biosynthesis ABC-type transport system permease subunit